MIKKRFFTNFNIISLIFIVFSIALIFLGKQFPYILEEIYSKFIYKYLAIFFSNIFGIFPFSVAEILIFLSIITLTFSIFILIKKHNKVFTIKYFINLTSVIMIFISAFILSWGLNYYRPNLSNTLVLPVDEVNEFYLQETCVELINGANSLRNYVDENDDGIFELKSDFFKNFHDGYSKISDKYSLFNYRLGTPKKVLLSEAMCHINVTGIYIPYTFEANINKNVPDVTLPATICHEMAHQYGFAREDEASFISYLACINSNDTDYQYSGYVYALVRCMNTLYKSNPDKYFELRDMYSDGLTRDIKYNNEFWKKYDGKAAKTHNKINDTYLKANGQNSGVQSYNEMVNYVVAYHIKNK